MYLFLLVLGALLTVAGVVLAASGVSVHDRVFDASVVTPGIVSFVGGLLLIGFGLALRVLQRIEWALAVRTMPQAARPGELPRTAVVAEPTLAPRAATPLKASPQPTPAALPPLPGAEKPRPDDVADTAATVVALETTQLVVEAPDLSLSPVASSRVDEAAEEFERARAARRKTSAQAPIAAGRLRAPAFEFTMAEVAASAAGGAIVGAGGHRTRGRARADG